MIEQIQAYLKNNKLDAFLILTAANRRYLSGFTGENGSLLITRTTAALFVDGRYTLRAKKEAKLSVKGLKQFSALIKQPYFQRIAVEDKISLRELAGLKKQRRQVAWQPTKNVIEDLRMPKT